VSGDTVIGSLKKLTGGTLGEAGPGRSRVSCSIPAKARAMGEPRAGTRRNSSSPTPGGVAGEDGSAGNLDRAIKPVPTVELTTDEEACLAETRRVRKPPRCGRACGFRAVNQDRQVSIGK
jgi:hypothetical protein